MYDLHMSNLSTRSLCVSTILFILACETFASPASRLLPAITPVAIASQQDEDESTRTPLYRVKPELISFALPPDAVAETTVLSSDITRVRIGREGEQWLLSITISDARDTTTSAADTLKSLVESRKAQLAQAATISITPLERMGTDTRPAFGATVRADVADGSAVSLSTSYAVMKADATSMVIVQLDVAGDTQGPDLTAFVDSFDFSERETDQSSLNDARVNARNFLERIDPSILKEVLPLGPILYRIYSDPEETQDPAAQSEVGYQRITVRPGQRGEMKQGTPKSEWREEDEQPGYIALVETRLLSDRTAIDTRELHFLSEDGSIELTDITSVTGTGASALSSVTTLFRAGNRLTVQHEDSAAPASRRDWNLGDRGGQGFYIPRLQFLLLSRLITHAGSDELQRGTADFAFYAYDPSSRRLTTRRDFFAYNSEGRITQRSTPTPESQAALSVLNTQGDVLTRSLPGGVYFELTEPRELRRLWQSKGLPIQTD